MLMQRVRWFSSVVKGCCVCSSSATLEAPVAPSELGNPTTTQTRKVSRFNPIDDIKDQDIARVMLWLGCDAEPTVLAILVFWYPLECVVKHNP